MLEDDLEIRRHRAGMRELVEGIDHGDFRIRSRITNISPLCQSRHEKINHTLEYLRRIGDRLRDAQRGIGDAVANGMRA
jgi:hypothetical protein